MAPRFQGEPVSQQRFAGTPVDQTDAGWAEPGVLAPIQYRLGPDGKPVEWRWATPRIITDTIGAMEAPGKALKGEYGLEVDPETYRVTPFTQEMIGDAMGAAGLGLTPFNPAVAAGAKFAQGMVKPSAARLVRRELDAAQIPASEIGTRLSALGPDAVVADLSPGLRARAAAIATMPGSGQKTVVDALSARRAASNARIQADVDTTLGPAPTPSRLLAEVKTNQQALSPAYRALFEGNELAVDTSDLALTLDSLIVNERGGAQAAAKKVRDMLNVTGVPDQLDPNPATLLNTRQAIDGLMETEVDSNTMRILELARKEVDSLLSDSVPGIKEVDAQYAELARQKEALGTGQQLLDTGRTALRPDEVDELFTASGLPQGAQIGPSAVPLRLSQGARAEIDRIIGTNIRDINAMKRIVAGEGNWNRDRLVSAFGEEKATKLLGILEREAIFNATEEMALQGSRTQVLKAAQEDIMGKGPQANPIRDAANFKLGDAAVNTADAALGWLYRARRGQANESLANALMMGPTAAPALGMPRALGPIARQGGLNALRLAAVAGPSLGQR